MRGQPPRVASRARSGPGGVAPDTAAVVLTAGVRTRSPLLGTYSHIPSTAIKVPSPSGFRIWWIVVDPEWHVSGLAASRASARIAAIRGLPWMRDLPTAPSQDLCQADRSARDSGPLPRGGARLTPLGGSSTLTPAEATNSPQTALTRTSSTLRLTVLPLGGHGHMEGVPMDRGSVWGWK